MLIGNYVHVAKEKNSKTVYHEVCR